VSDKPQTIHDMANYVFNEAIKRTNEDKFDEAAAVYGNIIDLHPALTAAYMQRGRCHWEMHRWDEALKDFEAAYQLNPNDADVAWTLALMRLQQNNFRGAWPLYEKRWESRTFKSPRLRTGKKQWEHGYQSVSDRILVWPEQGLGDQIIYASLLNKLKSRVKSVTAMVDMRLVEPLKRGMPDIKFIPHDAKINADDFDYHIPIASLGSYFIDSVRDIHSYCSKNYIKPDPNRTDQIRNTMGFKPSDKLIGLSWASTAKLVGKHKSCTLEDLLPVLAWGRSRGYKFVSLQYGEAVNDLQTYADIIDPPVNTFFDIDGVCSLIDMCSCVVSVSNVNVHLAGAMGKHVYLLDANKLWYWNNRISVDSKLNKWYPTVRVYPREHMLAPWEAPIKKALYDMMEDVW